jgi:isopentenyl-diphosphate delta-isomerase
MGRIAVVDSRNRFVRWTERAEIHAHRLPHRTVQILLFDVAGRLVVQQRHRKKQTFPGCWDLSASGHVEEEDYLAGPDDDLDAVYARVARRELLEELGVETALEPVGAYAPEPDVHYEHMRLFRGVADGPYILEPNEVAAAMAVTRAELDALLGGGAACTPTLRWFADRLNRWGF